MTRSRHEDVSLRWRLLDTGTRSGAENMAIDAALLAAHADGLSPPTLHVFDWRPIAVSLGRMQMAARVADVARCQEEGVDLVRRPTGGKAVVHSGDFTFSLITTAGGPIPDGVRASYGVILRIADAALSELGVRAVRGRSGCPGVRSHACFASATIADMAVDGRKLIGGAQYWLGNTLLQQNSLLLAPRPALTFRYLRPSSREGPEESAAAFSAATCGLRDLLGETPDRGRIVQALVGGLRRVLAVEVAPGGLSRRELLAARELIDEYRL